MALPLLWSSWALLRRWSDWGCARSGRIQATSSARWRDQCKAIDGSASEALNPTGW